MENNFRRMKQFKKSLILNILSMIIIPLVFWGCSDENFNDRDNATDKTTTLLVKLHVLNPVTVNTRTDDETALKDIRVLIFKKDGSLISNSEAQIKDSEGQKYIVVNSGLNNEDKATLYVVANTGAFLNDFDGNLSDLETIVFHHETGKLSPPFIMIGKLLINQENAVNELDIHLSRLVAKVTLMKEDNITEYEIKDFAIHNVSNAVFLKVPENDLEMPIVNNSEVAVRSSGTGIENPVYIFPSYGAATPNHNDGAFLTLRVSKDGRDGYFRINLRKADKYNPTPLNFEANHWYKLKIKAIHSSGYSSEEEAISNPEKDSENIDVVINDEAPGSLSMVSDGIRELGVNPVIEMTSSDITTIIRCFSSQIDDLNDSPSINIKVGSDWLSVETTKGNSGANEILLNCKLSKASDEISLGIRTALIEVSWKGLSREIHVSYNDPSIDYESISEYCNITLHIYNPSYPNESMDITNYWGFIHGLGTFNDDYSLRGETDLSATPRLFGLNNENKTNGLHFPMPIGNENMLWYFEYELDFTPLQKRKYVNNINVTVEGDIFFEEHIISEPIIYNPQKIKISLKDIPIRFEEAKAVIKLHLIFDDNSERFVTFSLFYSGIFYFNRIVDNNNHGYYYNEIKNINGQYWLDRNIGAKYCNFNLFNNGKDYELTGWFYSILQGSPKIVYDEERICPDGYTIPTRADWDNLMDSNLQFGEVFIDGKLQNAYYVTTDNGEKIYFPVGGFYSTNTDSYNTLYERSPNNGIGEGYYWTKTPDIEKTNWYQVMKLYNEGYIFESFNARQNKMNVRCIYAGSSIPD